MARDKERLAAEIAEKTEAEVRVVYIKADYQLLEEYTREHREYLVLKANEDRSTEDDRRFEELEQFAAGNLNEYLKKRILLGKGLGDQYLTRTHGTNDSIQDRIINNHVEAHKQEIIDRALTSEVRNDILMHEREKIEWWYRAIPPGYYHKETKKKIGDIDSYIRDNAASIIKKYLAEHEQQIIGDYITRNEREIILAYNKPISAIDENCIVIAEIEQITFGDGSQYNGLCLENADLSGSKFGRSVDFRAADLTGVILRDTDLRSVIFEDCTMHDTDLRGADLKGTWIRYTDELGNPAEMLVESTRGLMLSYADCDLMRKAGIFGEEFFSTYDRGEGTISTEIVLDPTYVHTSDALPKQKYTVLLDDLAAFASSGKSSESYCFEDYIREHKQDVPENIYVSLKGQDISASFIKLAGLNLRGTDFSSCRFDGLNMEGVILSGSCLEKASMLDTNLKNARMNDVNASLVDMAGANMQNASLDRANFERAILSAGERKASVQGASFRFANFRGAYTEGVNFSGANGDFAKMESIHASSADMSRISLRGANLRKAVLDHVKFVGAHMERAILDGAAATEVDLTDSFAEDMSAIGTDLRKAMLDHIDARGADFSGALMDDISAQEANFKKAILDRISARRANLTKAIMEDAKAREADLQEAILEKLQGENVDLSYSILKQVRAINANLREAKLQAIDAQFADLTGVILKKADLRFATLKSAVLENADIEKSKLQAADLRKASLKGAKCDGSEIDSSTRLEDANMEGAKDADHLIAQKKKQEEARSWGATIKRAGRWAANVASGVGEVIVQGFNYFKSMFKGSLIGATIGACIALICIAAAVPSAGSSLILGAVVVGALIGAATGAHIQSGRTGTDAWGAIKRTGNTIIGRNADGSVEPELERMTTVEPEKARLVEGDLTYIATPAEKPKKSEISTALAARLTGPAVGHAAKIDKRRTEAGNSLDVSAAG